MEPGITLAAYLDLGNICRHKICRFDATGAKTIKAPPPLSRPHSVEMMMRSSGLCGRDHRDWAETNETYEELVLRGRGPPPYHQATAE
jgi:hypothetical protein